MGEEKVIRPTIWLGSEYEDIKAELSKLPREKIIEEFAFLIYILRKYSPVVLEAVFKVGQYFAAVNRRYDRMFGVLVGVVFEPTMFIIAQETSHEFFTKKLIIHEKKLVQIPVKSLLWWEFIPEYREIPKEPEKPSESTSSV